MMARHSSKAILACVTNRAKLKKAPVVGDWVTCSWKESEELYQAQIETIQLSKPSGPQYQEPPSNSEFQKKLKRDKSQEEKNREKRVKLTSASNFLNTSKNSSQPSKNPEKHDLTDFEENISEDQERIEEEDEVEETLENAWKEIKKLKKINKTLMPVAQDITNKLVFFFFF